MTKILIVATYPIKNPQHGGQKRVDAVVRRYRQEGFEVKFVAVFSDLFYSSYTSSDIAVRGNVKDVIRAQPFTGDVECGKAIYSDPYVRKKVTKLLSRFQPDIIQVEQVYPYIGLKPLLKTLNVRPKIVSSSHNIEYKMKQEMLEGLNADQNFIDETVEIIRHAELNVTRDAVIVGAVSKDDIVELRKMGARETVLAPNGMNKFYHGKARATNWEQLFRKMNVNKVAVFVGSAHPPNWVGFKDMIGQGLGFVPREHRIVLAGTIAEYAKTELDKQKMDPGALTFWRRAFAAGKLSQPQLEGLLQYSDTILLPITEGGGSNLKTAEAVISGKKVVATSYAFRGFESLKMLSNIYIADTPESFRKRINEVMSKETVRRSPKEEECAQTVLWDNCLASLVQKMKELHA